MMTLKEMGEKYGIKVRPTFIISQNTGIKYSCVLKILKKNPDYKPRYYTKGIRWIKKGNFWRIISLKSNKKTPGIIRPEDKTVEAKQKALLEAVKIRDKIYNENG